MKKLFKAIKKRCIRRKNMHTIRAWLLWQTGPVDIRRISQAFPEMENSELSDIVLDLTDSKEFLYRYSIELLDKTLFGTYRSVDDIPEMIEDEKGIKFATGAFTLVPVLIFANN